jgi:hypothetical protein
MTRIRSEPGRYYDGGSLDGNEKPNPRKAPDILLERVLAPKKRRLRDPGGTQTLSESFELKRRIAYRARWSDRPEGLEIIVPAKARAGAPAFRTDLTSVPDLFTWLVPRTGLHLPAALIHDGLIYDPSEPASYEAAEPVPRIEADRILRDGMVDLGTGIARRWLIWSAVTLATVSAGVSSESPPGQTSGADEVRPSTGRRGARDDLYYRVVVFGSLLIIAVLGVLATVDLFDCWNVLPWMGERSVLAELAGGVAFAVLVPALLAAFWRKLWQAGLITGWALALLLHVTIALAVLTFGFQLIEWAARHLRHEPARAT